MSGYSMNYLLTLNFYISLFLHELFCILVLMIFLVIFFSNSLLNTVFNLVPILKLGIHFFTPLYFQYIHYLIYHSIQFLYYLLVFQHCQRKLNYHLSSI